MALRGTVAVQKQVISQNQSPCICHITVVYRSGSLFDKEQGFLIHARPLLYALFTLFHG